MSNEVMILKSDAGGRTLVPLDRQVELVREFERSGLSGPRFAAMAGVKYQTFATWRRKHGTLPGFNLVVIFFQGSVSLILIR